MSLGWLCATLVVAAGCDSPNTPTYFPAMGPLGLEAGKMGAAEATATFPIPFRAPSDIERKILADEGARLKFTMPWLRQDKVGVSVQYTLRNLADKSGTARITVNGSSEFANYDVAAQRMAIAAMGLPQQQQDEIVIPSLIQPAPLRLEAGEVVSGVIREDDFAEAALDLDAIGRWMARPASVLINRSEVNPIGMEKVPQGLIVPALFRVYLTLTASVPIRIEFTVRVRDGKDQLLAGDAVEFKPMPRLITYMRGM
jgi:hypothetical protein